MLELADPFGRVRNERAIRGLIVTGVGDKAFVAGADINELAVLTPVDARAYAERPSHVERRSPWVSPGKSSTARQERNSGSCP